ncbi:putative N6-adenine-specific DNA methylase [Alkalispirochaeta americana]|uniref:Putative N6-adenine-specific DNA methylase n=1 Tax=Alkalispirochaeta americana TaxID=159291 RepID=A0A1N6UBY9_9SPIO|nr:THUMP domain-containing protein [Alkalispirochaeta americana]SIQ63089.1 putative N6-adenine-specific DNA methylase [Alkalispirochaeta americana]
MQRKVILKKKSSPAGKSGMPGTSRLVATCAGGMEPILLREVQSLGFSCQLQGAGAVDIDASLQEAHLLCRSLRTASRLLLPLDRFHVRSYDDLYRQMSSCPWETIVPLEATFAITASTRSEVLGDHRFLAMRLKDAIVDRQRRENQGRRSSVDRKTPDVPVVLFVDAQGYASVSLDAAGSPLHERGYRREAGDAPLRETVAAAMLLEAGSPRVMVDPFCGSGTIAIESALLSAGLPPHGPSRHFALEGWPGVDPPRIPPGSSLSPGRPSIFAADLDSSLVEIARRNARRAGMEPRISFRSGDVRQTLPEMILQARESLGDSPRGRSRINEKGEIALVTNPPYGERLNPADLGVLYSDLGKILRQHLQGCSAWILCSEPKLIRRTGLNILGRRPLYNGGIACELYHFEIRRGSPPGRNAPGRRA